MNAAPWPASCPILRGATQAVDVPDSVDAGKRTRTCGRLNVTWRTWYTSIRAMWDEAEAETTPRRPTQCSRGGPHWNWLVTSYRKLLKLCSLNKRALFGKLKLILWLMAHEEYLGVKEVVDNRQLWAGWCVYWLAGYLGLREHKATAILLMFLLFKSKVHAPTEHFLHLCCQSSFPRKSCGMAWQSTTTTRWVFHNEIMHTHLNWRRVLLGKRLVLGICERKNLTNWNYH